MVTAAVYWDFNSKLIPFLLIFQHRAGVRPYTSSFDFAESCVFVKQLLPSALCHQYFLLKYWHSFFRSYGVILPSSFNIIISIALVYSTSSPVLVLVRFLLNVFSWNIILFISKFNYFINKIIFVTYQ